MSDERFEWLRRIKSVDREHAAMELAARRLIADAARDPTILAGDLRVRDARRAFDQLEGTYLIRLFAEFETGLRLFWAAARESDPPGRTRDLLDGVAATRDIKSLYLADAHKVRAHRNSLIHARQSPTPPVPIALARDYLCRYFQFLPFTW